MPWGLLIFLAGLLFGAFGPSRLRKFRLLKHGLLVGIALAVGLAIVGSLTGQPALGVGGAVAIIWGVLVMTGVFILGAWIGRILGPAKKHRASK